MDLLLGLAPFGSCCQWKPSEQGCRCGDVLAGPGELRWMIVVLHDLPLHLSWARARAHLRPAPGSVLRNLLLQQVVLLLKLTSCLLELSLPRLQLVD